MRFWLRLALFIGSSLAAFSQHTYRGNCIFAVPTPGYPRVSSDDASFRCAGCIAERKAEAEAHKREDDRITAMFAAKAAAERADREAKDRQRKASDAALAQSLAATVPAPATSDPPEKLKIKDDLHYGIRRIEGVNLAGLYTPLPDFKDDRLGTIGLKADGTGFTQGHSGLTFPLKWWIEARPNGAVKIAGEKEGVFKMVYLIFQFQEAEMATYLGKVHEVAPAGRYDIKNLLIDYREGRLVYMNTYSKSL